MNEFSIHCSRGGSESRRLWPLTRRDERGLTPIWAHWSHGSGRRAAPDRVLQGPGARGLAAGDGLPQRRRRRRGAHRRRARDATARPTAGSRCPGSGRRPRRSSHRHGPAGNPTRWSNCVRPQQDLGGGEIRAALRGDLHVHSNWSDGSAPIEEMMIAARRLGPRVLRADRPLAAADGRQRAVARTAAPAARRDRRTARHGRADADPHRHRGRHPRGRLARPGARAARAARRRGGQRALQAGDGRAGDDAADDQGGVRTRTPTCSATAPAGWSPAAAGMRPESKFDAEKVFTACRDNGTAVEINSRPERRDPPTRLLNLALEIGCAVLDRHRLARAGPAGLPRLRRAACARRRASPVDRIVNTWPADEAAGVDRQLGVDPADQSRQHAASPARDRGRRARRASHRGVAVALPHLVDRGVDARSVSAAAVERQLQLLCAVAVDVGHREPDQRQAALGDQRRRRGDQGPGGVEDRRRWTRSPAASCATGWRGRSRRTATAAPRCARCGRPCASGG